MRITMAVALLAMPALLCGCGSSSEHGEVYEAHEAGEHHEGMEHEGGEEHEGEGEHGHAAGPVSDFHAVLSPLWHAEHGPARTDATCSAVGDLRAKAAAVEGGPVPEHAEEGAYRQAGTTLKSAVEDLATACGAPNRPDFEARFRAVHEAFHLVSEIAEGEHGEREEHGEEEEEDEDHEDEHEEHER